MSARFTNRTQFPTKRRRSSLVQIILFVLLVLALHDLLDTVTRGSLSPQPAHRDATDVPHRIYLMKTPTEQGLSSCGKQAGAKTLKALEMVAERWPIALKQYLRSFARWSALKPIVVQAEAIRLLRIEAPASPVQAGHQIWLRCLYKTNRDDRLQSLSWYKNGREFYRYQPFERRQPVLAFNLTGVDVDMIKSKNSTVVLTNTTSETSGRYRCEATGTSFQEVNMETYINVIAASSGAPSLISRSTMLHHSLIVITLISLLIS